MLSNFPGLSTSELFKCKLWKVKVNVCVEVTEVPEVIAMMSGNPSRVVMYSRKSKIFFSTDGTHFSFE